MERHSLFAVALIVYCGLLFMLGNSLNLYIELKFKLEPIPTWGRWVLFAILVLGIAYFIIYWLTCYVPAQIRYCLKNKWLSNSKLGFWLSKITTSSNGEHSDAESSASDSVSYEDESPSRGADSRTFSNYFGDKQQLKDFKDSIDTNTNKTETALMQETLVEERNQQLFRRVSQDGTVIALSQFRQRSLAYSMTSQVGVESPLKRMTYQPTLAKIQEDKTENQSYRM